MRSTDLAPLLLSEKKNLGMRQGVVQSWDSSTGSNTIKIGDTVLDDLPVLASTGTVLLGPGDVVGLLRYKSTYFVLGRIGVAGEGALAIQADFVAAHEDSSSAEPTDLPTVGPTVVANIGSTRRCLVFLRASIGVNKVGGSMSFTVTGASNIGAGSGGTGSSSAFLFRPDGDVIASCTSLVVLTADDGLNEGQNTFQAKYARYTSNDDTQFAVFENRYLTVLPF